MAQDKWIIKDDSGTTIASGNDSIISYDFPRNESDSAQTYTVEYYEEYCSAVTNVIIPVCYDSLDITYENGWQCASFTQTAATDNGNAYGVLEEYVISGISKTGEHYEEPIIVTPTGEPRTWSYTIEHDPDGVLGNFTLRISFEGEWPTKTAQKTITIKSHNETYSIDKVIKICPNIKVKVFWTKADAHGVPCQEWIEYGGSHTPDKSGYGVYAYMINPLGNPYSLKKDTVIKFRLTPIRNSSFSQMSNPGCDCAESDQKWENVTINVTIPSGETYGSGVRYANTVYYYCDQYGMCENNYPGIEWNFSDVTVDSVEVIGNYDVDLEYGVCQ